MKRPSPAFLLSALRGASIAAVVTTAPLAAFAARTLYEAPAAELGGAVAPRVEFAVDNTAEAWPTKFERLFVELWCDDSGEDATELIIRGGKGAKGQKRGEYRMLADLPEKGRRVLSIPYAPVVKSLDVASVSNIVLRTVDGEARRFGIARMMLLAAGEEAPQIEEAPHPRLRDAAAHHEDYLKFREECRNGAFVIGWATSMESVRPRAGFKWRKADNVHVRLARGERESVQLLVAPAAHDLKDVRVEVIMEGGPNADFASSNVTASVVGYVETRDPPPYKTRPAMKTPARGWWPDPILDFQRAADIAGEDLQSFWLRVTCPENQAAGTYTGRIVVSAANATTATANFTVRVNDFAVERVSPLPLAVSCLNPGIAPYALDGRVDAAARVRDDPDSFINAWQTREEKYCDFFADYYLSADSLYLNRGREPHWEMLSRLRDQGRLGMFNLGYWWYIGNGEDAEQKWREGTLAILRKHYEKAKELGIEKHAYLYGCDEQGERVFTNIAKTVEILHREIPGVPVMTTARDRLLGTGESPLRDVDILCPATCFWNGRPVKQAQAEGRKVWWYFCNNPADPFANSTLEGPPCELRSLMGAQTQKFMPDGFLYYATMKWNSRGPIVKGPFTDWNPCSTGNYHGDGQWTCCGGPEMLPLATLRLENFRDGLEDLWYAKLLEKKLREMQNAECTMHNDAEGSQSTATDSTVADDQLAAGEPPAPRHLNRLTTQPLNRATWVQRARAALAVPDEVARLVSDFSTDPEVIYRWRDEMADLIEDAGRVRP